MLFFEAPQKNTCKHDICVLSVGEHFREESVKQCSNTVHKKTLSPCVVLGVPLASEAKYFQETLMWLAKKVIIIMFNSKTETPSRYKSNNEAEHIKCKTINCVIRPRCFPFTNVFLLCILFLAIIRIIRKKLETTCWSVLLLLVSLSSKPGHCEYWSCAEGLLEVCDINFILCIGLVSRWNAIQSQENDLKKFSFQF